MNLAKRPPLPVILLANDLLDGEVVFRTEAGWSRNPREAVIAFDDDAAQALELAGQQAYARNEVVEVALVDVGLSSDGQPIPNHFRERFKVNGPTVRPDLGKQSVFGRL